jgi:serine/threonine protein kinase
MGKPDNTLAARSLVDEYGNIHYLSEELARGGQGVVFRTTDADLAIKQPLDAWGNPDKSVNLRERFQSIRFLPLPPRIPISLPLAILRDEPGYVMRLLNGMKPFEAFELNGTAQKNLREAIEKGSLSCPKWLERIPDEKARLRLLHYARTGSTRRRLFALSQCASILARLHSAGLVYGDISPKNVFVGEGDFPDVWLIDADNLRLEMNEGGSSVFTPHYGAPEVVQGRDRSRPRTDCWAFAVLAFQTLSLTHPFIGKKVLEPDSDEGGWDADPPVSGDAPADPEEQAYAGYLPFIDDEDDNSNAAVTGSSLPRELVTTPELRRLFQETFGTGRTQPHRRPAMAFWALELARAFDHSMICPDCTMSYFIHEHTECPYCRTPRPLFARGKTPRWEICIPQIVVNSTARTSPFVTEFTLPHRLFHPFSFEHNNAVEYEVKLDWTRKTYHPVRGTKPFPPDLSIKFVEAVK